MMFLSAGSAWRSPTAASRRSLCGDGDCAFDALFVDDLAENVDAAASFDMAAHQHVDNRDTIQWVLSQLGAPEASPAPECRVLRVRAAREGLICR